jgi:hypothetical protein
MVTQDQAVEIAKAEFEKHGRSAAEYTITVETYRADNDQWIVWFDRAAPFRAPGGKHAVLVHKTTGRAVFMPGE